MTEDLVNIAETGIETETFFRTKLGRYLLTRADEERANLVTRLIAADPEDSKLNRNIRNDLSVIDMFLQWTSDAVNSGNLAHQQLSEEDAEH